MRGHSHAERQAMRIAAALTLAMLVVVAPTNGQLATSVPVVAAPGNESPSAAGEPVKDFPDQLWGVFQAKDNAHWFGSNGQGVYHYDGRTLVRFTTVHGLGGNHVRGVWEDHAGSILVHSVPGGIHRFDGRAFSAVPVADAAKSEWKLTADDLWFSAGQDTGAVYRYDGKSLHRLPLPKTETGEAWDARHPRSQYPNIKYRPYDVYSIFRDSRGHVWFGTSNLGACRYDGTSFAWVGTVEVNLGVNDSFGVRSIIEDRDGKFWFTTTRNRFAVDPSDAAQRGVVALSYRKEPGLAEDDPVGAFVAAVKDRNGDLWLATLGGGVYRYDGTRLSHYPVLHDGQPIWVASLYQDLQGALWLSTQEHGVYKLNGKVFERFKL